MQREHVVSRPFWSASGACGVPWRTERDNSTRFTRRNLLRKREGRGERERERRNWKREESHALGRAASASRARDHHLMTLSRDNRTRLHSRGLQDPVSLFLSLSLSRNIVRVPPHYSAPARVRLI